MNLARVYDDAAAKAGSPGRWGDLTPLQREAVEVMAGVVEAGHADPVKVADVGVTSLAHLYGLPVDPQLAETYLPIAQALLAAHAQPACAWADALPTTFPYDDPAPGAYVIPADEYHADPLREHGWSVNASTLRGLAPPGCPALVRWDREHPQRRDCWDLGTVAHTLTLGIGGEIMEVEHKDWRTKDARETREWAREHGAVALLTKELDACRAMADAVRAHPLAGGLLRVPGASEVTLVWREPLPGGGEVWARCMVDRHPDPSVVAVVGDLKTAAGNLDAEGLQRKAWDLGYHQAAEWYGRGYRAVHGQDLQAFWLLFVRKEPPHLVHVVELDADLLARARATNDEALQTWVECTTSGVWPGPGRDDEPTLIGAPRWVR